MICVRGAGEMVTVVPFEAGTKRKERGKKRKKKKRKKKKKGETEAEKAPESYSFSRPSLPSSGPD